MLSNITYSIEYSVFISHYCIQSILQLATVRDLIITEHQLVTFGMQFTSCSHTQHKYVQGVIIRCNIIIRCNYREKTKSLLPKVFLMVAWKLLQRWLAELTVLFYVYKSTICRGSFPAVSINWIFRGGRQQEPPLEMQFAETARNTTISINRSPNIINQV